MKKLLIVLSMLVLSGCNTTIKETTLKESYKDYFDIGVAVTSRNLDEINIGEYSTLTAEYEMKWDQIQPVKEYDFTAMDIIADYARENNMYMRGHTVVWYQTTPEFIKEIDYLNISNEEKMNVALGYIKEYYETVYNRYSDILNCFDIVNEVISDSNNPNELYRLNDPYYMMFDYDDELFERFIKEVYKIAREISPDIDLYYNDYYILNNYTKRNKALEFISRINKDEKLIDGMGAQSHITTSITQEDVSITLDAFRKLDVQFSFTELDISVYENEYELEIEYTKEVEIALARAYNAIFSVARQNSDIVSNISFWGINDSMTWLDQENRKNYPLLFDINGNKKYAYDVINNFMEVL